MLEPEDKNLPEFNQISLGDAGGLWKRHINKWFFLIVGTIMLTPMSLWVFTILLLNKFIHIDDQPLGEPVITISKAVLNEPGFVVVRDLKFFPNQNINKPVIALSKFLERGIYKDVALDLFNPALGIIGFQEELKTGDRIQVTIYEDDGDGIFNQDLDKPAVLFLGQKIQDTVSLR